jgi:hypothetical protein
MTWLCSLALNLSRIAALSALILLAGCGGGVSEVDSAERVIRDAPKPAEPAPATPSGETPAAKEAPKG